MEEFRLHEEKMKAYQKAKKNGGRPPLGKEGSSLQVNTQISNGGLNNAPSQKQIITVAAPGSQNQVPTSKVAVASKAKGKQTIKLSNKGLRKSSNMRLDGSQNSKTSTAHTNGQSQEELQDPDSDGPKIEQEFILSNETGVRGAQPNSNKILDTESTLIEQKKEKCIEVFRNNHEIRDMIVSPQINP